MVSAIIKALSVALGFNGETGVVSKLSGLGNYTLLATALTWGWLHRDEVIHFEASLGFVAIVGAGAFLLLEINRRA